MLLVKHKKHYVELTWNNKDREERSQAKGGVVFKVGKGEYRGVLKGLEGLTGLTAVNVDEASRGGTSDP